MRSPTTAILVIPAVFSLTFGTAEARPGTVPGSKRLWVKQHGQGRYHPSYYGATYRLVPGADESTAVRIGAAPRFYAGDHQRD